MKDLERIPDLLDFVALAGLGLDLVQLNKNKQPPMVAVCFCGPTGNRTRNTAMRKPRYTVYL